MDAQKSFTDLVGRLRRGDAAAAVELVRRYEPQIRREVRTWLRLRAPDLTRVLDSVDICQSVLASFLVRTAAGQYDLDEPGQLPRLLAVMARHKLAEQVRYHHAQARDVRRAAPLDAQALQLPAADPGPGQQAADRELLDELRSRLSDQERQLAEQRAHGRSWGEIAAELGGTADGRRMQLARAAGRVARELGLDGTAHD